MSARILRNPIALAVGALMVTTSTGQEPDREARAVRGPIQVSGPVDPGPDGPLTVSGEPVTDFGGEIVETMEDVMRREAVFDASSQVIRRQRNGRHGTWTLLGRRNRQFPHSGDHYVANEWGDTRMGIGFNGPVDLAGAWFAAVGNEGAWAKGLAVVGYRDGEPVGRTEWFRDIDRDPSYFAMDLAGVDRIEILAEPAYRGAGWYGMDDLTFTDLRTGRAVVIDFEDLAYEDRLTGSGYAGLAWEQGTGVFDDEQDDAPAVRGPLGGGPRDSAPGGGGSSGRGRGSSGFTPPPSGSGSAPNILMNFRGPRMFDTGAAAFPPDTCGAAGIDHFVTVVNSNLSVYTKAAGTRVMNTSLGSFFNTNFLGDPRVVFDPDSQRWVIIATNFSNRIFIGVSKTSDPTSGGWFKAWFNPSQGADANRSPDYPTLGVDKRGVYLGVAMFGSTVPMTIFTIDKAPMVAASPSLGKITAFRNLPYEASIQPCVHWEDVGVEYLVSVNGTNRIRLRRVNPPLTSPTLTNVGFFTTSIHPDPPNAPAKGSNVKIETLEDRLMNAVYRVGAIWTAHTVNAGTRAGGRWYSLDPANMTVNQKGTIKDDVGSSLHFYYPTIAVNSKGDALVGVSGSDANNWVGTYLAGRKASDTAGQMSDAILYQPGLGPWNRTDGFGRNRWGDYSLTSADPTDDTLWTMQEYGGTANRWVTRIAQAEFDGGAPCPDLVYCAPTGTDCPNTQVDCNTAGISISGCEVAAGSIIVGFDQDPGGFIDSGFAGYLNVSMGGTGTTTNVISDGVLCLVGGGAIGRYAGPDTQTIDAAGHMQMDILNSAKTGGCDIPLITAATGMNYCNSPGTTWTMQWWFRRSMMNPVSTLSGFSQALQVTIN